MNNKGFTLLEVTLFLAISGALALIAFIGLGPRLQNQRFTQATRSLEASIEQNFSNALSGNNNRTDAVCNNSSTSLVGGTGTAASAGSAEACVLNGRLAVFDGTQVTYRAIVSLTKPSSATCNTAGLAGAKNCYGAVILTDAQGPPAVYKYSGGLTQTSEKKAVGYVVNPETGERTIFSGVSTGSGSTQYNGRLNNTKFAGFTDNSATSSEVCFKMGERNVKVAFTNQSLKPELKYEEACA